MNNNLETALVTGAGSGIGAAIAEALDQQGFSLLLLGRNESRLQSVAKNLTHTCDILVCDLADPAQIQETSTRLLEHPLLKNGLHRLINNAGIFSPLSLENSTEEHWQEQMNVNFLGPVHLTRRLLPALKKASDAAIVNIASTLATSPKTETGAYSSSKAALAHWTKILALELAPLKIRVNCVSPGLVDTPIHSFYGLNEDHEVRQKVAGLQPLGRIGQPREIAAAVSYFCSKDAQWTTGAVLNVDGGISLL